MKALEWSQYFSHHKSMGIFLDTQGQLTPSLGGQKYPWLTRSICQKVVNTCQNKSEWSIEIFELRFWWWIEILGQVIHSIYWKRKRKKYQFVPAKGTFYLSTDFCITVQAPNISLFQS